MPARLPDPNAAATSPGAASAGTYVGDAEEREEEGGQDDEEGEELPVPAQQLELVDQPGDHRLHSAHLRPTEQGRCGAGRALCPAQWPDSLGMDASGGRTASGA